MIYAAWMGTLATAAGMWAGLGAGLVLPLLAFAGLAAFEREAAALKLVRAFLASRKTPLRARASLKRQRAAIATVLDRTQDWLESRPGG